MRSRNWSRTLTERSGGNGAVLVFMDCYDCCFVQSMPCASRQQALYDAGRCSMLRSSADVTQQGSRPKTKFGVTSSPCSCAWRSSAPCASACGLPAPLLSVVADSTLMCSQSHHRQRPAWSRLPSVPLLPVLQYFFSQLPPVVLSRAAEHGGRADLAHKAARVSSPQR